MSFPGNFTTKQLIDYSIENLQHARKCKNFISKMAHLKTAITRINEILGTVENHNDKCECGGDIFFVSNPNGVYLQCSCCDWSEKGITI